jgi:hypothetical protein
MSRGTYTQGKRNREAKKAHKKREKAEKLLQKREQGRGEVPIVAAEEITVAIPTVDEAMLAIEMRAAEPRRATSVPCRLFVGGLSYETTVDDLKTAFGEYGVVSDAVVVKESHTGKSKGFGFVTLENRKDAARAVEGLNDSELGGRTIVVNVATARQR